MGTTNNLPLTGAACTCRRGIERDNCSRCEGTGRAIDWRAYHAARADPAARIAELEAALAAVIAQRDRCREAVEQLISQLEPVAVDVHEVAAIEDARAALRACDEKGGAE